MIVVEVLVNAGLVVFRVVGLAVTAGSTVIAKLLVMIKLGVVLVVSIAVVLLITVGDPVNVILVPVMGAVDTPEGTLANDVVVVLLVGVTLVIDDVYLTVGSKGRNVKVGRSTGIGRILGQPG